MTLPWKTVRDVIGGSLHARFVALAEDSASWPCDLPAAQTVKIKVAATGSGGGSSGGDGSGIKNPKILVAASEVEPSEIQDLADLIPQLLELKAKSKLPLRFHVRLELGDGSQTPPPSVVAELNKLLGTVKAELMAN